jgi:hypothetical protein
LDVSLLKGALAAATTSSLTAGLAGKELFFTVTVTLLHKIFFAPSLLILGSWEAMQI